MRTANYGISPEAISKIFLRFTLRLFGGLFFSRKGAKLNQSVFIKLLFFEQLLIKAKPIFNFVNFHRRIKYYGFKINRTFSDINLGGF